MFHCLFLLIFLSFAPALLADPPGSDYPQDKSVSEPQTDVSPSQPSPSPSSEGSTSQEPSTTKDQMGTTFDPSTMIPDKPIVEEKNPERKRLLDRIFEAGMKEAEAKMRLDELKRVEKDLDERFERIMGDWDNRLDELDKTSLERVKAKNWESEKALIEEENKIWREIDIVHARLEAYRRQTDELHKEVLSTIHKLGSHILHVMGLENALQKMDDARKEVSRQDAKRALIPKPQD